MNGTFVPRSARRRRRRAGVIAAVTGVVVAAAVVAAGFVLAARSDDPDVHFGDERFVVGRAERLAAAIDRQGPLLFADLAGGTRDIWLNHEGAAPDEGWSAFDARPAGAPRRCQVEWEGDARRFRDPCGDRTYPADGAGLPRYDVAVEAGDVVVDLARP